jgi:hypothetical protein
MNESNIEPILPLFETAGIEGVTARYPDLVFHFDDYPEGEDTEYPGQIDLVAKSLKELGVVTRSQLSDSMPEGEIAAHPFMYSYNRIRRVERFIGANVVGLYVSQWDGRALSRGSAICNTSIRTVNTMIEELRPSNHPVHQLVMQFFVKYRNSIGEVSTFDVVSDIMKQTFPSHFTEVFATELEQFLPIVHAEPIAKGAKVARKKIFSKLQGTKKKDESTQSNLIKPRHSNNVLPKNSSRRKTVRTLPQTGKPLKTITAPVKQSPRTSYRKMGIPKREG